ncbi:unnamed protein product [Amoebophrya sp. A120]|nr:unnamed protein product [Amoebophrya sp. A120]|eukprot:GSA120T00017899001.1
MPSNPVHTKLVPNPATPVVGSNPPATYGRGDVRAHSEPRSYWASAFGTGNYHFRVVGDDWIQKRNGQVVRMTTQTEELKKNVAQSGVRSCLTWDLSQRDKVKAGDPYVEPTKHQKLNNYDINGFIYASASKPVPPPEQNPNSGHWITEVNSTTGEFNVVNNLKPSPFNHSYREAEVKRFRSVNFGKMPAAGQVQPAPIVTCYDIQSFVPVRKAERMPNYLRIKPNL